MSDELKPVDPAALAHVALPPALVEMIQENPELLVELARGQLAIVQDRMVQKILQNPDATPQQMAVVHERLAKVAKIEGNAPVAVGPSQVVINIIRRSGKGSGLTIEGTAAQVSDDSAGT